MFVPFHAQWNKWNKMEQKSAFLSVLAELGLALWQNLGLPLGSAVGLCPTVPLPIDGSEAACRRQVLSLLGSSGLSYCWRLLQTFRS